MHSESIVAVALRAISALVILEVICIVTEIITYLDRRRNTAFVGNLIDFLHGLLGYGILNPDTATRVLGSKIRQRLGNILLYALGALVVVCILNS